MKLRKWMLWMVAPVPVAVAGGYFASSILIESLKMLVISSKSKEFSQIPDFQIMEGMLKPEAFEYISYIHIPAKRVVEIKKEENVQKPKKEEKPPEYRVTFTFVGTVRNYAIINGRLLKEGDPVSENEKIIKIRKDGVLLTGKWGERWLKIME